MKKRLSFRIFTAVTLVLLVLFSAGCTTAPVPRESGVAYELTVLHTNDHHGTVLAKDGGCRACRTGNIHCYGT